jgi:hypothetical protein
MTVPLLISVVWLSRGVPGARPQVAVPRWVVSKPVAVVRSSYAVPGGTVQKWTVLPPAATVRVHGDPDRPGQVTVNVRLVAVRFSRASWRRPAVQSTLTSADMPVPQWKMPPTSSSRPVGVVVRSVYGVPASRVQ